jgi:hypothetical protein
LKGADDESVDRDTGKTELQGLLGKVPPQGPPTYDGEHWDLREHGCPDCHTKPFEFYEGPSGGCAVNICCTNPLCRSAFWMTYGQQLGDDLKRISNVVFRGSFPVCPEESDAYIRAEELKKLREESDKFMKSITEGV